MLTCVERISDTLTLKHGQGTRGSLLFSCLLWHSRQHSRQLYSNHICHPQPQLQTVIYLLLLLQEASPGALYLRW